jgi:hypothetical protein
VSEKELTAASIEDAERDAPKYDWDGVSPINGEAVTQRVRFADREYVFTEKCVYLLKGRAAD